MIGNSRLFEEGIVTHRIPLDLILEILTRLPAKSVLSFKCVCKEWYNLINSPLFPELHLNKSLELNSQHNCILYWTNTTLYIIDDLYHHPVKVTKLYWPKDTIRDRDCKYHVGSCNGLVCFKVIGKIDTCFLICNPLTRTFKSILLPLETIWKDQKLSYGFGYDSEHNDYKIVGTRTDWRDDDGDRHVFIYSLKNDL
ncbi:putative F-box protein At3g16210 [Silene latifolia]|uniref:putative F-box protein At3g16210 n=1 Tax=Silene latifolia TaxID=37657 RepID=UPI003D783612